MALFHAWMEEAKKTEPNEANAMGIATVDAQGRPECAHGAAQGRHAGWLRLLYQHRERQGPRAAGPAACRAVFPLEDAAQAGARARIRGAGERRGSGCLFRHARRRTARSAPGRSAQSRPMEGRFVVRKRDREIRREICADESAAPAILVRLPRDAAQIEFWRDRPFRLHDRLVYLRDTPAAPWRTERLFP